MTASVGALVNSWAAYYSDHQMVSLAIRYLHIAALMIGGGTALAIDKRGHLSKRAARRALRSRRPAKLKNHEDLRVPCAVPHMCLALVSRGRARPCSGVEWAW